MKLGKDKSKISRIYYIRSILYCITSYYYESAEWRQEDERVRQEAKVYNGEGLAPSGVKVARVFLLLGTHFMLFLEKTESRA